MKVIIIQKCNYGKIGEVIDVKSGFGNNFLIKQKLAVRDSAKARQQYINIAKKGSKKKEDKNLELNKAINKVKKGSVLNIHSKANEKSHLYAAVSEDDFIKALESQLGIPKGNLDIKLLTVVKELGKHEVEFSINNINKKVTVNIKQLDDNQPN